MRTLNSTRGFTLIELMVVIGILGILAAAVLLALNPIAQLQKASDSQRKQGLQTIHDALQQFYIDHGRYPNLSYGDYANDFSNYDIDSKTQGAKDGILPILVQDGYIKGNILPPSHQNQYCVERTDANCYEYVYLSDGNSGAQTYILETRLENKKDPDLTKQAYKCAYCAGTGCYCLNP